MIAKLDQQKTEAEAGIRTLANALNASVRNAALALESVARQFGYENIVVDWRRAQESVYTDPREAITRSSSLIETVCKYILGAKNVPLPQDQRIRPLLKATLKVLELAPVAGDVDTQESGAVAEA
jgi:hypothetical protein